MDALVKFKRELMIRRVASRFVEAMEFDTPEALREYLKDHPGADKSKHRVKKPSQENGKAEDKPKGKDEKAEETSGEGGKQKTKAVVPKSKPMANPKKAARVGVAGDVVPPPPKTLPKLANLKPDEQEAEKRINSMFEDDPDGVAKQFSEAASKDNWVFETDAAKNLLPDWSRPDLPPDEKGKPVNPERAEFRAKYNAVLHQAANAIAKKAFMSRLDDIAKMPEDKRNILVTSGGVAAGKGMALAAKPELKESASATWDAAGEQNATENEWLLEECKKRGIKPTFLFVHADPKKSWSGVVARAKGIGRMVDAQLFADSYAQGAKNFHDFHQKHKDEANFVFGIYPGVGPDGKPMEAKTKNADGTPISEMPKEALELDADDIYQFASKYVEDNKKDLPSHIYDGATIGRRAFKG